MRRLIAVATLLLVSAASAQGRKTAKEAELGKKETSAGPDKSLAGDVTRKKEEREVMPALQYDQFRLGVEMQVASKRRQQMDDLKKIIELTPQDAAGKKEMPKLLFRLGELYWEESKFYFFEANRKDDDLINAMNRKDKSGQERAKAEKQELLGQSKGYAKLATDQYSEIVQRYKDYERTDEVLYFLGHNLMEMGEDRKSLIAYRRLIDKYPKSKFLADAYLAFGEYYFNNSKGKRDMIEKALEAYKKAASFTDNAAYGFALYKQGWCYFNLSDYQKAMDQFKAVVLYGQIAGEKEAEGAGGGSKGRAGLVREARNDFVRTYARSGGTPTDARAEFAKLASKPDDRFMMMKNLANLYYEDGKDREAALTFNMLIKERPLSPEAPGFQSKIVDCVLRAGNKKMTVDQVRRLVKIMDDVEKAKVVKGDKEKKLIEEAKELSERTISKLAVDWHNEARKTRDEETFGFANEVYSDYLTLFPDNAKAYDLRFYWAELLNDNLARYDKAAEQYTLVLMKDVACIEKGGKAQPEKEKKKKGKGESDEVKPDEGDEAKTAEADPNKGGKCKVGKWMSNAAYNAVLANDAVVKNLTESGKLKPPVISDSKKKLDIPLEKRSLLEACERYVKYLPNGEKKVEIAYKAAKIYYDYNHLDEAVGRLADIALKHPDYKFENGDKAGEIAANLVLDSYNQLQDWAKLNEWARKFYAEDRLAQGRFRDELAKLIEQSAFKLVNQLESKKEFCKAGEAYLAFVSEFPKSEIADKALFNAAIDFFNCRQLDKAIEQRKRIVQNYPKSEYVPKTIFALAEGYEAIADFDNAADYYEAYATAYEKSLEGGGRKAPARPSKKGKGKGKEKEEEKDSGKPAGAQVWESAKAQIALYNAGVFREGLGQFKQAERDRERYLALFGDEKGGQMSKDAEAVMLSIADLHEKSGAYQKAMKQLEEYERRFLKDPNKVLTAEGRIANIYENKLKNARQARRIYDRILSYHDKLPTRTRKALEISALDAVARAHYVTSEEQFAHYSRLKLRWSKLANVGEFKNSLAEKTKSLDAIQKLYTVTVGFKSADPAICALNKIGQAYDQLHKAMLDPPVPKGMPEELLLEFKAELERQAEPVKAKAVEAFSAAVQKSQELDVFNQCTTNSLDTLRERYQLAQFPKMAEEVAELKGAESKSMVVGGDFLTSIQPIPVVSQERAAEARNKANEVGRNVADLDGPPPPERAVKNDSGSTPQTRQEKPAPKKPANEEPEDEPL